jgi:tRNA pseudouridine55 synthase
MARGLCRTHGTKPLTTEAPRTLAPPEGLLLVDKPGGITSHDVVQLARKAYHERSIGHLGTLDPFATGLLILLLGRATRLATFIVTEPKVYDATIRFGTETDTDDRTGTVIRECGGPPRADVERGIDSLTGRIRQVPPAYSAKSVDGTRAYDAARKGEPLDLPPVEVDVAGWAIREWREDEIDVTITCGSGTYIRALARDLGRIAGSCAHLTALRRTRAGDFRVEDAVAAGQLSQNPPRLRQLRIVASDD